MTKPRKEQAKIISLTPDAARKLLANNVLNRPLRNKRIHDLSRAIKEGRWMLNGASIVVDRKNRLMDGQHRCHAVIRANKAVSVVMVTGVDPKCFDTIDQGAKRSGSDIFHLCGVSNPSVIASALTIVYQDRHNVVLGTTGGAGNLPDMDERVRLFDSIPHFEDTVRECVRFRDKLVGIVPLAMMAGLYFLFQEKDKRAAQEFLYALTHESIHDAPPAILRTIMRDLNQQDYHISRQAKCAYLKLTWNAFVAGEKVDAIRLPGTLDIPINEPTDNFWIDQLRQVA